MAIAIRACGQEEYDLSLDVEDRLSYRHDMKQMISWPAWPVIDELGAALGASEFARSKWRQRGVPYRLRLPMIEEAERRGIDISGADLDRPGLRGREPDRAAR